MGTESRYATITDANTQCQGLTMWETSASFTNPVEAQPQDDFGIGSSEVQARSRRLSTRPMRLTRFCSIVNCALHSRIP